MSHQKEVADIFNEFYLNVASEIGPRQPDTSHLSDYDFVRHSIDTYSDHESVLSIQRNQHSTSFSFAPVSVDEISKQLRKLDERKATGSDSISPKFLKLGGNDISKAICHLVNQTIANSKFPDACKEANVTPIYKKGDHLMKNNYRPVSVLPTTSKLIEASMNVQIQSFISQIYSPYLAAFRRNYSTQHVLLKLVEEWKEAVDRGLVAGAVLMDLSKAFDCLPHDLLIAKMHAYGFDHSALQLCASYLRQRKQRIKIGDTHSE